MVGMIGKLVTPGVCAARRRFDSGSSHNNSKIMKVYIAGKVSDLPVGEVFIKFSQAEYWLKSQGHEVVNPIRLCSSAWTWEQCMRVLIPELMKCDAICLLHDWADSRGARWEYHDAQMLGMKVMVFKPKYDKLTKTK